MPEKNITAIILAGGKSFRMKEDKGLVSFNGKMLIKYVIDSAKRISTNIVIITSNTSYEQFGYPCIKDELKERGPLGGILTGLINSATTKNLLLGCDMPFLSENIMSSLIQNIGEEDVLLTEHQGKAEPLCSVYDKNCITHIRSQIEQNQLKITNALGGLKTRIISFDKEDWFKGNEFVNINSFEEMRKYEL
jgi:molybdopterin-guanine dinucleotide biosynthesis protein A